MVSYHNIKELLGDISILFNQLQILDETFQKAKVLYTEIGVTQEKLQSNYAVMGNDIKQMEHLEDICQKYIFNKTNIQNEIL